jgi:hypothetical protein
MKLSKKAQREADEWAARVEAEGITVGLLVTAMRVTTDARSIIRSKWWELAIVREVRAFDAVVEFGDGTKQSSGLGLKVSKETKS